MDKSRGEHAAAVLLWRRQSEPPVDAELIRGITPTWEAPRQVAGLPGKAANYVVGRQHLPTTFGGIPKTPKKSAVGHFFCFTGWVSRNTLPQVKKK
jgi:hypothetical protein